MDSLVNTMTLYKVILSALVMLVVAVTVKGLEISVDTSKLEEHLRNAFSKPRSYADKDNLEEVRKYIRDYIKEIHGADFKSDNLVLQNVTSNSLDIGTNIIYIEEGTEYGKSTDKPLVLGAHYDTVINSPGVDDNGSGMAALLECMRVVQCVEKNKRQNTIIFAAFDLEERGVAGSTAFVDLFLVPQILSWANIAEDNFQGAIIMDTIMNFDSTPQSQTVEFESLITMFFPDLKVIMEEKRGDFIAIGGRKVEANLTEDLRSAWDQLTKMDVGKKYLAVKIELPIDVKPSESFLLPLLGDSLDVVLNSDHAHFWEVPETDKGLKAVILTDTGKLRSIMRKCYHEPCDNITMLLTPDNLNFLAKTTAVVTKVLLKKSMDKSDDVHVSFRKDTSDNGSIHYICLPGLLQIIMCAMAPWILRLL